MIPEPAAEEYLKKAREDDEFAKQEGVLKLGAFSEQVKQRLGYTHTQVSVVLRNWVKKGRRGETAVEGARMIEHDWYITPKLQGKLLDHLSARKRDEEQKKPGRAVIVRNQDNLGNTIEEVGEVRGDGRHSLPPPGQGAVRLCSIRQMADDAAAQYIKHLSYEEIIEAIKEGTLPSYLVRLQHGGRLTAIPEESAREYLEKRFRQKPEVPKQVAEEETEEAETRKAQGRPVKVCFIKDDRRYEVEGVVKEGLPPGAEKIRVYTIDRIIEEAQVKGIILTLKEIQEAMKTGILPRLIVRIIHGGRVSAVPEDAARKYYEQLRHEKLKPEAAQLAPMTPQTGGEMPYDADLKTLIESLPQWMFPDLVLDGEIKRLSRKHKADPKTLRVRLKALMPTDVDEQMNE